METDTWQLPASAREREAPLLHRIRHAREDYVGQRDRLRRLSAVRSFLSNSVSLTWTVQNLRHREPSFEEWWAPWQQELKNDEVAQFFYMSRVPAIHEGQLDLGSHAQIHLNTSELHRGVRALVPPGPYRVILGDSQEGGTCYAVGSDGKKVYFDYPGTVTWESIRGMPDHLTQIPLPVLMDRYIAMLERIIVNATIQFNGRGNTSHPH